MARTARFIFDQDGQEAQVVLHIEDSAVTNAAIALSLKVNLWNAVIAMTSFETELIEIQVGTVVGGSTLAVGEVGTGGSAACPSNVAILIAKEVEAQRNGRMFWPGLMDDDVDAAGRIEGSAATAWDLALSAVVTNLFLDGIKIVVVHEPAGGPITESAVTMLATRPVVGTQRRRLR